MIENIPKQPEHEGKKLFTLSKDQRGEGKQGRFDSSDFRGPRKSLFVLCSSTQLTKAYEYGKKARKPMIPRNRPREDPSIFVPMFFDRNYHGDA